MKMNTKSGVKPFCKVCHDAKKSESEYTSHSVRSADGKVTCPTLLSQNCRYCHENGHTVKFCTILADKKKEEEHPKPQMKKVEKKVNNHKQQNTFAVLSADYESDNEEKKEKIQKNTKNIKIQNKVEDFPSLGTSMKQAPQQKQIAFSYALMASKTIDEYNMEQHERKIKERAQKRMMPPIVKTQSSFVKRSWVEMMDESESEGEDEYEDENYDNDYLSNTAQCSYGYDEEW